MSPALQRKKKARVRESVANARFRMLRNAGGGICLVGALVGVAGTIANSGATHPRGPWVAVCLVGAALAVFCGVLGEAGMRATRAVNAEHARKLRETGWLLQESLGFENACNYGSGQREREAFRAHYLALARGLDCWDRVLREQRVSDQALRDGVAQLINELEGPEGVYDAGLISAFMNGVVDARLGDDGVRGSTSLNWRPAMTSENPVWGVVSAGAERWIILPPAVGESPEDWHQRDLAARKPVEEILDEVQTMPMDAAVAARQRVREFKNAELPELNDDLARVAERSAATA